MAWEEWDYDELGSIWRLMNFSAQHKEPDEGCSGNAEGECSTAQRQGGVCRCLLRPTSVDREGTISPEVCRPSMGRASLGTGLQMEGGEDDWTTAKKLVVFRSSAWFDGGSGLSSGAVRKTGSSLSAQSNLLLPKSGGPHAKCPSPFQTAGGSRRRDGLFNV
jgi:hypothetical protein